MTREFEIEYHKLERDHFWFKTRRNCILQLLRDTPRTAKILDIGCSSGLLLNDLIHGGFNAENLYGLDISPEAISNCKKNNIDNTFVMDAQAIDLAERFDIIIASDCLEHINVDQKALYNWYNLLKTNGKVIIFVPAFKFLWSGHDEANMHFRRYTKKELNTKLAKAEFKIIKSSYWNFFLFAPIVLLRSIKRFKKEEARKYGDLHQMSFWNPFLTSLLNFENKLLSYFNFPFGVSVFSVASKASSGNNLQK